MSVDEGLDVSWLDLHVRTLDDGVSGQAGVGPVLGEAHVHEGVGAVLTPAPLPPPLHPGIFLRTGKNNIVIAREAVVNEPSLSVSCRHQLVS